MRLIAFILAAFVIASPAAAQSWKEYRYSSDSFGVSFPAEPKVESTMYQAPNGKMVGARVYSVNEDGAVLSMTIADFSDSGLEEDAVIGYAIKSLSANGAVKLDIPHRISAVYGRQLSIAGKDGSHSSVAVFFYKKRLYQIEGKALPNGDTADAIRFQQSLIFTDRQSNRSLGGRVVELVNRLF
ncbi:MAG TPA: hypothetical protein VEU06_12180 [Micropepsaceae bacterium]|nr:hypothetical protein [Micropepsaceae bacterium]